MEWFRLETIYWKPLVDSWVKDGNKGSWSAFRLWMPEGDDQPYNAIPVDIFADWDSLVHGLPLNDLWPKVHAHTDRTQVFDQLDAVRSRHDKEIYKVMELVSSNKAAEK